MCVFLYIYKELASICKFDDLWKRSNNGGYSEYRVGTGQIREGMGRRLFPENFIILTI